MTLLRNFMVLSKPTYSLHVSSNLSSHWRVVRHPLTHKSIGIRKKNSQNRHLMAIILFTCCDAEIRKMSAVIFGADCLLVHNCGAFSIYLNLRCCRIYCHIHANCLDKWKCTNISSSLYLPLFSETVSYVLILFKQFQRSGLDLLIKATFSFGVEILRKVWRHKKKSYSKPSKFPP